jgi:hypothetical protein
MRPARVSPARIAFSLAPPILVAAVLTPYFLRTLGGYDLTHHFAPAEVAGSGGAFAAAFSPRHLVDVANLLVVLAPALIPALAVSIAGGMGRVDRVSLVLGVLAVSNVAILLFVHPQQGVFRDWDVFTASGVAFTLLAALVLGRWLAVTPAAAWLAVPLAASLVVPTVQWLLHAHDSAHGLARAYAFATEPPARSERDVVLTLDFVAARQFRLGRWEESARASQQAIRVAPNPRTILMLALARTMAGEHVAAQSAYAQLLGRVPHDPVAWFGYGGASLRVGDSLGARRAIAVLDSMTQDSASAATIRRFLSFYPAAWPSDEEIRDRRRAARR